MQLLVIFFTRKFSSHGSFQYKSLLVKMKSLRTLGGLIVTLIVSLRYFCWGHRFCGTAKSIISIKIRSFQSTEVFLLYMAQSYNLNGILKHINVQKVSIRYDSCFPFLGPWREKERFHNLLL